MLTWLYYNHTNHTVKNVTLAYIDIEDEMHMLCTCTLYHHIIIEMYNNVIHKNVKFHQLNDEQKCIYLVSTEWKEVSTFLDKSWTMRTNLLYCTR